MWPGTVIRAVEPLQPRLTEGSATPSVRLTDVTAHTHRIAVVTGGGSGIGAAAGLALAADGWHVVLVGRRPDPLRTTVDRGAGLAGSLEAHPGDVTDEAAVDALFDDVVSRHGRLDLLFNNAGIFPSEREFDEIPLSEWDAAIAVNLTGAFLCARAAFRVMRRQTPQGGRIVNNGSIAAYAPRPRATAYTVTKHAISGLTKALTLDGRSYGIACGQIDVGNAETDMTAGWDRGRLQADGSVRPEPTMDVADVGRAIVYMAGLPPEANVASITVMATAMPYLGRG